MYRKGPMADEDESYDGSRQPGAAAEAAAAREAAAGVAGPDLAEELGAEAVRPPAGAERTAGADEEPEEVAVLRDRLLRLAAEFDNYRKRVDRERSEAWGRAKADLIEKLLGPIDDLSRVAHPEAAAGPADSRVAGILAGVELVERKMLQALEREGLQVIEAEGAAFDPALHEAVLTRPTGEAELDGIVAQVVLPGYRFADRLLRPAKVVVWKLQR
jgi:molecular chaperone GrpE